MCGSQVYCENDDCDAIKTQQNKDLPKAATYINMLKNIGNDFNADNISIFTGKECLLAGHTWNCPEYECFDNPMYMKEYGSNDTVLDTLTDPDGRPLYQQFEYPETFLSDREYCQRECICNSASECTDIWQNWDHDFDFNVTWFCLLTFG